MGKRTKGHDRDKYYHLAKDQGYRARSAFKLIEINKKHDILSNARVVIDLCAAPGSWCQVAAKAMPTGGLVIGVDLLPIRPVRGAKTLIGDITTDECRRSITKELQTWKADAVLCDGAPNVGAEYSKDAYVQNEIALAALKVATQHLVRGGAFVTKVYRSQDYNALLWVVQHFFEEHHAVKPASSRSQSAEIFLVGLRYKDPAHIDPKMLDPRVVFDQSHEEGDASKKGVTIFHKKFEQHNKRKRQGYDDDLGHSLVRGVSVTVFVNAPDPIRVLTDCQVLRFEDDCALFRDSALTTPDILRACSDLRVLGKTDFKHLLKWRLKMREYREELDKAAAGDGDDDDNSEEGGGGEAVEKTEEEEEAEIQDEIRNLRLKVLAEKKRQRKKEREAAARLRRRAAMGMETRAVDLPEDESIFTLATLAAAGHADIDALHEVDLTAGGGGKRQAGGADGAAADGAASGASMGSEEDEEAGQGGSDSDDWGASAATRRRRRVIGTADGDVSDDSDDERAAADAALEEELEEAYATYLSGKSADVQKGTRAAKRAKRAQANKAADQQQEDTALFDGDKHAYLKMLAGDESGSAEDMDSSDDNSDTICRDGGGGSDSDGGSGTNAGDVGGFGDDPDAMESDSDGDGGGNAAVLVAADAGRPRNPLLTDLLTDKARRKERTSRWFVGPLFEGIDDVEAQLRAAEAAAAEAAAAAAISAKAASKATSQADSKAVSEDAGEVVAMLEEEEEKEENEAPAVASAGTAARATKKERRDLEKAKRARKAAAAATVAAIHGDDDDASDASDDGGGAAAAVLAAMPKTDKQIRKEKRRKAAERKERRDGRRRQEIGEDEEDLQVVAADDDMAGMTPAERARTQRKRDLIRAGMGAALTGDGDAAAAAAGGGSAPSSRGASSSAGSGGFEIAKAAALAGALRGGGFVASAASVVGAAGLARQDERTYESGSENYDDEDRAQQLALGTMMLRRHRAKALADAAYNRFAWNDDRNLPSWFVDDEQQHYRPQVPIPKELLEQMRQKFMSLAAKPIKKVAEARARKRKRVVDKLKAARKKAEALAANPDLSERQKLKAVQAAMRRGGTSDKPSKVYVVAKKGGGSAGHTKKSGKGAKVKLVDSRMKADKRAEKVAKKRSKTGGNKKKRRY